VAAAPGVLLLLPTRQIPKPTILLTHTVQAMSVPAILGGGDFLVASHTGSGKTLAYLLPMVSARHGA
jgi:superfamily II DNA/RNA helicase